MVYPPVPQYILDMLSERCPTYYSEEERHDFQAEQCFHALKELKSGRYAPVPICMNLGHPLTKRIKYPFVFSSLVKGYFEGKLQEYNPNNPNPVKTLTEKLNYKVKWMRKDNYRFGTDDNGSFRDNFCKEGYTDLLTNGLFAPALDLEGLKKFEEGIEDVDSVEYLVAVIEYLNNPSDYFNKPKEVVKQEKPSFFKHVMSYFD